MTMSDSDERILRLSEVQRKVGLKHSTIYKLLNLGKFPPSFPVGDTTARGWLLSDIDAWIRERAGRRIPKA
jgi:prophage regulatory protein